MIITNQNDKKNLSKLYLEFISNIFFNFLGDNDLKYLNFFCEIFNK
jgi:hypothetical protein